MIIDAHVRTTGRERSDEVLHALDEAQVDMAVLIAPFPGEDPSLDDRDSLRRGNEHLARLVQGHGDRLAGFAVVDPRDPQAPAELRRAVETLGLRGCKMVPTGWYPYDDAVQPVFAAARELGIPLLLHSGISPDGRSGRFCRPSFFEALRAHPGLKVTLSQLGWPWTDEAIAVGLVDRLGEVPPAECLFRFDVSFGAPPPYRRDMLHRALEVLGPDLLQFGSGCLLPASGARLAERIREVRALLDELEVPEQARERIWSGTAAAWLGLHGAREPAVAPRDAEPPGNGPPPPPPPSPSRVRHPIADCRRAAATLPDPFSPLSF